MSHRDFADGGVRLNVDCLKLSLNWLFRGIKWSNIAFRHDCTWTPRLLTATALLWSWSDEGTLGERFHHVRRIAGSLWGGQRELATSYQAFIKMLRRWTESLLERWLAAWWERLPKELGEQWLLWGYVVFGVDGSRAALPRTQSHEQAYSASRKRAGGRRRRKAAARNKKLNVPQLWLTTLLHVASGLPWNWRIGPADSSEREHLLQMLPCLPAAALLTADAGFVGYQTLQAILASGHQLLIRVGANVKLLRKLGYARESDGCVYLWPDREARRGQPPLVLRLVVAHNGKSPVYLVTSVTSTTRLSDEQVVQLYAKRWGIELFYRHLKQTFGRRKLRSAQADNARLELQWSLAALAAMALYALVQLQQQGIGPQRLSMASTLRFFRRTLRDYLHPTPPDGKLQKQLTTAVIDPYQRKHKTSRDYPRKKQERPPGKPRIVVATREQIALATVIKTDKKKRLTA